MRIKVKVMILIIILLFLMSLGCIWESDDSESESKNTYHYNYYVDIQIDPEIQYEIIVPVMITPLLSENNGSLSEIMVNLDMNGAGNYSIIETEYGNGLKINGKGNLLLQSEANEKVLRSRLNMLNDTNNDGSVKDEYNHVEYFVYINLSGIPDDFYIEVAGSVSANGGASISFLEIEEYKGNGWIIIEGTYVEGVE